MMSLLSMPLAGSWGYWRIPMKKGDKYVGKKSGLCLKIKDTSAKELIVMAERRTVDKRTGEIKVEERERVVPIRLVPTMLLGYEKA
jgi:hypothetical protein